VLLCKGGGNDVLVCAEYHRMKMYVGSGDTPLIFLNLGTGLSEWSASCAIRFTSEERHSTYGIFCCVGPRDAMGAVTNRKIFCLC
jgi:hypothetical protein